MGIHTVFDLLAVATALLVFGWLKLLAASVAQPWKLHPAYLGIAALGMVAGARSPPAPAICC